MVRTYRLQWFVLRSFGCAWTFLIVDDATFCKACGLKPKDSPDADAWQDSDLHEVLVRGAIPPDRRIAAAFHEILHFPPQAPGGAGAAYAVYGTDADDFDDREEAVVSFLAPPTCASLIEAGFLTFPTQPRIPQ